MNIRTILPLALSLLLFSCSDDDKPSNTQYLNGELTAVVIPTDASQEPVITTLSTKVTQQLSDQWQYTVGVDNLILPSGEKVVFSSPQMYPAGAGNVLLEYFSNINASTGQTIRNLRTELINEYYYVTYGSPVSSQRPLGTMVNISFKVGGDYSVNTFPKEAYYAGTTKMADLFAGIYEDKGVIYRVQIDPMHLTAIITLNNIKFNQEMVPLANLTLSNLKVTPSREYGYVISGSNIIPTYGAGQGVTPYPEYTFNTFEFHADEPYLTGAKISYRVADKYKAEFTGCYPVNSNN